MLKVKRHWKKNTTCKLKKSGHTASHTGYSCLEWSTDSVVRPRLKVCAMTETRTACMHCNIRKYTNTCQDSKKT